MNVSMTLELLLWLFRAVTEATLQGRGEKTRGLDKPNLPDHVLQKSQSSDLAATTAGLHTLKMATQDGSRCTFLPGPMTV